MSIGLAITSRPAVAAVRGLALVLVLSSSARAQEIINASWPGSAFEVHAPDVRDGIASQYQGELAVGDLSGDGIPDMVVAAPVADGPANARVECGDVYVLFGPYPDRDVRDLATRPADVTLHGRETFSHLGFSAVIADLDGDTQPDLAMGARDSRYPDVADTSRGEVSIVFGPLMPGVIDLALGDPGLHIVGQRSFDGFGTSVAAADVSGDGMTDLIVGCEYTPVTGVGYAGSVKVLFGPFAAGPTRFLETAPPDYTVIGRQANIEFALKVAAGDISGDGVPDMVIAASEARSRGGADAAGQVYAILGPLAAGGGLDLRTMPADVLVEGGEMGDAMGTGLDVNDVTGDGVADLLIGARGGDGIGNGETDAGEVHVVFGPLARGAVVDNQAVISDIIFTALTLDGVGVAVHSAAMPGGRTRLLVPAPGHDDCGLGRIFVMDDLPPRGSFINLAVEPPSLIVSSSSGWNPGTRVLLADLSGDAVPEILFGASTDGPAGGRADAGAIYVVRPDDRCESAPAGLGPHGIDLRRAGDDVLIDFDGNGLGDDSIGVDVYRGTIDTFRRRPYLYDHVLAPGGCGVPASPHADAGAASAGQADYYYLATRGCPDACGPYRLTGDMGFKSTGAPRPLPFIGADALTCR